MMERLTKRVGDGIERVCHHYPEEEKVCYGCVKRTACNAALFDRLAYYEDLEEQGRLITLPCKVGDTVWFVENVFNGKEIVPVLASRKIDSIGGNSLNPVWMASKEPYELRFHSCSFGKTVFLTREEAERALGGAEG